MSMFSVPPTPVAITRVFLAEASDDDLEYLLLCYVQACQRREQGAADLPVALQTHYVAFVFDGDVLNGQLFFNAPEVAEAAAEAFEYLGMSQAAELAARAWGAFTAVRNRHAAAREAGTIEAFLETYEGSPLERFDAEYSALEDQFRAQRLSYVRAHPDEFIHPVKAG